MDLAKLRELNEKSWRADRPVWRADDVPETPTFHRLLVRSRETAELLEFLLRHSGEITEMMDELDHYRKIRDHFYRRGV